MAITGLTRRAILNGVIASPALRLEWRTPDYIEEA